MLKDGKAMLFRQVWDFYFENLNNPVSFNLRDYFNKNETLCLKMWIKHFKHKIRFPQLWNKKAK